MKQMESRENKTIKTRRPSINNLVCCIHCLLSYHFCSQYSFIISVVFTATAVARQYVLLAFHYGAYSVLGLTSSMINVVNHFDVVVVAIVTSCSSHRRETRN